VWVHGQRQKHSRPRARTPAARRAHRVFRGHDQAHVPRARSHRGAGLRRREGHAVRAAGRQDAAPRDADARHRVGPRAHRRQDLAPSVESVDPNRREVRDRGRRAFRERGPRAAHADPGRPAARTRCVDRAEALEREPGRSEAHDRRKVREQRHRARATREGARVPVRHHVPVRAGGPRRASADRNRCGHRLAPRRRPLGTPARRAVFGRHGSRSA